jgi:hypothetical protein
MQKQCYGTYGLLMSPFFVPNVCMVGGLSINYTNIIYYIDNISKIVGGFHNLWYNFSDKIVYNLKLKINHEFLL